MDVNIVLDVVLHQSSLFSGSSLVCLLVSSLGQSSQSYVQGSPLVLVCLFSAGYTLVYSDMIFLTVAFLPAVIEIGEECPRRFVNRRAPSMISTV